MTDPVEVEAKRIETMLIAPCCFSQQVSVHTSEAAEEVRRDIRARLTAGETRQQILDAYVAKYGTAILAEPPDQGFARLLHTGPAVALVTGVGAAALALRFLRRRAAKVAADEAAAPIPAATAERLDDELRDLD